MMLEDMDVSAAGAEKLIKKHEGLRLKAYRCPAGRPTIGWGTTKGVRMGMTISRAQAEEFFRRDIEDFEDHLERMVKVSLDQCQFDALTSLIYNIGPGNFKKSTLLKRVNARNWEGAAKAFASWNKARKGGQGPLVAMPGLTRRRADEARWFLGEDVKITKRDIEADVADEMPQAVETDDGVLKPLLKSKELLSGACDAVSGAAGAAGVVGGFLGDMPLAVQLGILGLAAVPVIGGTVVICNRLIDRKNGIR